MKYSVFWGLSDIVSDQGGDRVGYYNPEDTLTYLRIYYFENGRIGSKGNFVNGKQDGLWEWWYSNGTKKDETRMKEGMYVGYRKHWRENGTLKMIEMIDGKCGGDCCDGNVAYFDEKGQLLINYAKHNGENDGEGIGYFPDGKIKRKFMYVKEKKNGMNYEYYPNGQISAEGNYIDDNEDGQWTFRDSTGKITEYVHFKNGQSVSQ